MSAEIRRVVTGHDMEGRAIVLDDSRIALQSPRPGQASGTLWAQRVPADNSTDLEALAPSTGARTPGGATLRIVHYAPGSSGNMHRTQTLDFGIVLKGKIVLELDDGVEIEILAGETIVQRGTVHRWINRGEEPCEVAFVLLDALPFQEDGRPG